jgi:hypothetical protein
MSGGGVFYILLETFITVSFLKLLKLDEMK